MDIRKKKLLNFFNLGEAQFRYEQQLVSHHLDLLEKIIKGEPVPVPLFVEIHPSGVCDNECRWCRGISGKKAPNFAPQMLSKDVMSKLINELHLLGVRGLLFDGYYGEPLLNPATISNMREALNLGFQVGLGTNGKLLDEKAREVAVYANYVRISLDVGSNDMHNLLKRTTGKPFDVIICNLKKLIKLKKERQTKLRVGISFLIQPENISQIEAIIKKAKRIGVDYIQFKLTMGDPIGKLTQDQIVDAYQKLENAKIKYSASEFDVVMMQSKEEAIKEVVSSGIPDFKVCYIHQLMSVIGPDGNIYPCCEHTDRPPEAFGNINEDSFSNIWFGEKKTKVMSSIIPPKNCTICSRYNTRVNRFMEFLASEYMRYPTFFTWLRDTLPGLLEDREEYDLWEKKAELPSILGGKPSFLERINIIDPTNPTDREAVFKVITDIINEKKYNLGLGYRERFEEGLKRFLGLKTRRVIAVNSGTIALVLLLMGTETGRDGRDEVIVPSFTYHATIRAVLRCGLKPVFADINRETLNLDPRKVESLISSNTGAILTVDAFGNPADYHSLEEIASKYDLKLIIDSAGSVGSTYKGKSIGNFGDGAALSFSFGKIIQAFGRGGAIILDDRMFKILSDDPRGILASSIIQEVNAIMAYDNLCSIDKLVFNRQSASSTYEEVLKNIPGLSFQKVLEGGTCCHTHFPVIVNEELFGMNRYRLKQALDAEGIQAKEYFPAQHKVFKGYRVGDLKETGIISERILCLPVWSNIEKEIVTKVAGAVRKIYEHRRRIGRYFREGKL